ncbi:MAG: hypothetical protein HOC20_07135 [Chloroflexi bacterium]|nr:hypothetical protein [Chloroflexota bacterium]
MEDAKLRRVSVRMTPVIFKVFEAYAYAFGYKRATFVFTCAVAGLKAMIGADEYLGAVRAISGGMLSEPTVDAEKPPEG